MSEKTGNGKRGWRALAAALAVLGVLLGAVSLAASPQGTVLVLRSSDLAPYLAVQSGFIAELGSAVKVVSVQGSSRDELSTLISQASVVFAIGPEAAAAAEPAKRNALISALVSRHGLAVPIYASPGHQVRAIHGMLPDAEKLGLVYDPAQSGPMVDAYDAAARDAGLRLIRKPVHSRQEVAGALRSLMGNVDALWLVPDTTVISADTFKFMVELSIENKIPVIGFSAGMCKAGALLAVEATYPEMGRKAAQSARRALTGNETPPQPAEGALYVNASTASLLGLSVPSSVRDSAKEVFE